MVQITNETKPEDLWIRCVDIALLLILSDRNPRGLASEANQQGAYWADVLSLLSLSTIGPFLRDVNIFFAETRS